MVGKELAASSEEESGQGSIFSKESRKLDSPLVAAGHTGLDWAQC